MFRMSLKRATLPQRFRPMWSARVARLGVLPVTTNRMKAFEYSRKSTKDKEDQQVLSLRSQHEENMRAAARGGHQIVTSYEEEASAKLPGREKFNEMLDRIERGEADAIVCWRLNRLARNPIDGGRIQWLLQRGIIKAIITSEKTYLPTDNVIQMSVELGMATQYSIDLGKDVKRGLKQKLQMGWKPGIAPLGYLNDYGGIKGQKVIRKDPERFPIVRQCWEYLLTGAYTVADIHRLATEKWGLTHHGGRKKKVRKIPMATMYEILTNPFYCGQFFWEGQLYRGQHEAMISMEEFDEAQRILGSRGKPRAACNENPYPGLIRCTTCGGMVVMERKNKKLKTTGEIKPYTFFRCSQRKSGITCTEFARFTQKALEDFLFPKAGDTVLPRAFIEWALDQLKLSQEDRAKEREDQLRALQQNLAGVEKKKDELLNLRLDSPLLISDAMFQSKMQQLENEHVTAQAKIDDHVNAARTWRDDLIEALRKVEKIRDHFRTLNIKGRLEIFHAIGERIELKDGQLHFSYAEPFAGFLKIKPAVVGSLARLGLENEGLSGLQKLNDETRTSLVQLWSRLRDLNPGPSVYDTDALPLS